MGLAYDRHANWTQQTHVQSHLINRGLVLVRPRVSRPFNVSYKNPS